MCSFFFELKAEVIIRGRVTHCAKVLLGSKEIKLRNDGTFSLRFALDEGERF